MPLGVGGSSDESFFPAFLSYLVPMHAGWKLYTFLYSFNFISCFLGHVRCCLPNLFKFQWVNHLNWAYSQLCRETGVGTWSVYFEASPELLSDILFRHDE